MNDKFSDEKKSISVYNEAQLQILRLNNIWVECHECVKRGDLISYKWKLDRAWIELSADAKTLNEKSYFAAMKKINDYISKANNEEVLYNLLQKKEIFLKNLQEDAGKGSKRKREGKSWFS